MKRMINTIKGFDMLDNKQQYVEAFASKLMKFLKSKNVGSSWDDDNHNFYFEVQLPNTDIQPRLCFNISKDELNYDYETLDEEAEFIGNQILELVE